MEVVDDSYLAQLVATATTDGVVQLVVGAVIIDTASGDRRVLVLDRDQDDFMGGIEELPSGKVESGESLLEALEREVLEETGLEVVKVLGHVFAFDYRSASGRHSRQHNFAVDVSGLEVTVDSCRTRGLPMAASLGHERIPFDP